MRTFIVILTAAVAFGITALMGFWLIPLLRKMKYGQTILDIGPVWHKSKQGTPTMGGFLFIAGVLVSVTVGYLAYVGGGYVQQSIFSSSAHLFAGMVMALAFAFLGFVDDYIKVSKKQNLGLTATQKMLMQIVIAAAYLVTLYIAGAQSTVIDFPFFGPVDFGLFYYPLMILVIVFTVNAVNLTDGVDGLASSVTFMASIGFMILSAFLAAYEMQILSAAVAGAMIGFLVWNFFPAKVIMGDTGSMFLGGMIVTLAFGLDFPFLVAIIGIIYMVEAFSVVIQMTYFKLTKGKRLFKMTPIHHHFEMSGWSEVKIVIVFSLITALACALSIWWILSI